MSIKYFVISWICFGFNFLSRYIELYGNTTLGYYYVEAYVGSPPQKKSLIFDTGSRWTVFPCNDCVECGKHMNPPFNMSASATFGFLTKNKTTFDWTCPSADGSQICSFDSVYLEGSEYQGRLGKDTFVFMQELDSNDTSSKDHIFGCASKESGDFFTQKVDGIIGFGKSISKNQIEPPTLIDIEFLKGNISNRILSVCLGENGGQATLGDWNYDKHMEIAEYKFLDCSNMNWDDQYNVELSGIKVFLSGGYSEFKV
jgi:hypothetical protein